MAFLKASEGDVINKNEKMVGKTFTLLVLQCQTGRLSNRVTQLHYGYVIGQHFHFFFFVVEVSILLHNLTADSILLHFWQQTQPAENTEFDNNLEKLAE